MEQIDLLANFIMAEVEGEPSQDEGAGDCAIRIIKQLEAVNERLRHTIGFFASCIKSGESWSDTCQEHMNALKEGEDVGYKIVVPEDGDLKSFIEGDALKEGG